MIELDLRKLAEGLVWQLEMLAAIRRMAKQHGLEWGWIGEKERGVAALLRSLREVMRFKGNVMVVKPKG